MTLPEIEAILPSTACEGKVVCVKEEDVDWGRTQDCGDGARGASTGSKGFLQVFYLQIHTPTTGSPLERCGRLFRAGGNSLPFEDRCQTSSKNLTEARPL